MIGAALSGANPKNLALTLAASASIAEAGLTKADTAIAIAAFVALGSVTVAGSVRFYLVDADRAARLLGALSSSSCPTTTRCWSFALAAGVSAKPTSNATTRMCRGRTPPRIVFTSMTPPAAS